LIFVAVEPEYTWIVTLPAADMPRFLFLFREVRLSVLQAAATTTSDVIVAGLFPAATLDVSSETEAGGGSNVEVEAVDDMSEVVRVAACSIGLLSHSFGLFSTREEGLCGELNRWIAQQSAVSSPDADLFRKSSAGI
jgi:hypothetical protein